MSNLVPTMGRIVLFKIAEGLIRPALVLSVQPEGVSINLMVFSETGCMPQSFVTQGEGVFQWDWMPFQKDQQARPGYGTPESVQVLGKPV
jgi:hypothetical protein